MIKQISVAACLFIILLFVLNGEEHSPTAVLAKQVSPLPEDNLIKNPWFRDGAQPTQPGLDGWTDEAGEAVRWSVSQKESNPAGDVIESDKCTAGVLYCGTSARYANGQGQGGGVGSELAPAYLHQVVDVTGVLHHELRFQAQWVTGWIDYFQVDIEGSDDGVTWHPVWTPLSVTQDNGSDSKWTETAVLTHIPEQLYDFYRIRFSCDYIGSQGCKMTGVYFTVVNNTLAPEPTPTPSPPPSPIPGPDAASTFVFLPLVLR